jgi:hypothetical protein
VGNPVCYIDIQQWRCILRPLQATGVSVDADRQRDDNETNEEKSHIEDSAVPMWLQILDEEAAQLLAEEKD